jgi:hypothetical protein
VFSLWIFFYFGQCSTFVCICQLHNTDDAITQPNRQLCATMQHGLQNQLIHEPETPTSIRVCLVRRIFLTLATVALSFVFVN